MDYHREISSRIIPLAGTWPLVDPLSQTPPSTNHTPAPTTPALPQFCLVVATTGQGSRDLACESFAFHLLESLECCGMGGLALWNLSSRLSLLPRLMQIPRCLEIHPELSRRSKHLRKIKRRVCRNPPFTPDKLVQPGSCPADLSRKGGLRNPGWREKLLTQNLPWVKRVFRYFFQERILLQILVCFPYRLRTVIIRRLPTDSPLHEAKFVVMIL